jgi:hypothetical protein
MTHGVKPHKLATALLNIANPAPTGIAQVARQYGVIVSFQPGSPNTVTITLGGSTTPIAGVGYRPSYSPTVGDTVECNHVGSDVIVVSCLSTHGGSGGPVKVGALQPYAFAITDPAWLLCNGGTFSAATYPILADAAHLNSTTLPNIQGLAIMGVGANGVTLGATSALGQMPSHAHSHSHTAATGAFITSAAGGSGTAAGTNLNTSGTTTDATAAGSGTANMPPYYGAYVYIRAL